MSLDSIQQALAAVPPGAWAVGVSGGADSVALLAMIREFRAVDVSMHVVHLDHQLRGEQSAADARFVADLCARWTVPCTVAGRDEVEPALSDKLANPSAHYRALRLALFRRVVEAEHLAGVILAHHADDQAETVLHRLLRGAGHAGLAGIAPLSVIRGLRIIRPMLTLRRAQLRQYLSQRCLPWREDVSNNSPKYLRNRLRRLLQAHPALAGELLSLGSSCAALRDWVRESAPLWGERIRIGASAQAPPILAHESARRWLIDRQVPIETIGPDVIERLIAMASDAATPPRQDFPGPVRIRRRGGWLFAE